MKQDADTKIILVEGNYLLLEQLGWEQFSQYFDLSLYIKVPLAVLRKRLINRWLKLNLDLDAASA